MFHDNRDIIMFEIESEFLHFIKIKNIKFFQFFFTESSINFQLFLCLLLINKLYHFINSVPLKLTLKLT